MLANIRNAEYAQRIAELEQEISVLQMKVNWKKNILHSHILIFFLHLI